MREQLASWNEHEVYQEKFSGTYSQTERPLQYVWRNARPGVLKHRKYNRIIGQLGSSWVHKIPPSNSPASPRSSWS